MVVDIYVVIEKFYIQTIGVNNFSRACYDTPFNNVRENDTTLTISAHTHSISNFESKINDTQEGMKQ